MTAPRPSPLENMLKSPAGQVGDTGILVEEVRITRAKLWLVGDVCIVERTGFPVPLWRNLRTNTTAFVYPSRFTTRGLEA